MIRTAKIMIPKVITNKTNDLTAKQMNLAEK
jgi:hypothetical protein